MHVDPGVKCALVLRWSAPHIASLFAGHHARCTECSDRPEWEMQRDITRYGFLNSPVQPSHLLFLHLGSTHHRCCTLLDRCTVEHRCCCSHQKHAFRIQLQLVLWVRKGGYLCFDYVKGALLCSDRDDARSAGDGVALSDLNFTAMLPPTFSNGMCMAPIQDACAT